MQNVHFEILLLRNKYMEEEEKSNGKIAWKRDFQSPTLVRKTIRNNYMRDDAL